MTTAPAGKKLGAHDVESLLNDWQRLNVALMGTSLAVVKQLIEAEVGGRRRPGVLMRLYGRFNRLRSDDERRDLIQGQLPWHDKTRS